MVPRSDSPSPCRQQRSSSHGATPHVVGSDGSFIQPLAPASPPARGFSHTPPLPPAVSGGQCRSSLDPLGAFSVAASNLAAADGCLAAACSLLQFEIAEVCYNLQLPGNLKPEEGRDGAWDPWLMASSQRLYILRWVASCRYNSGSCLYIGIRDISSRFS